MSHFVDFAKASKNMVSSLAAFSFSQAFFVGASGENLTVWFLPATKPADNQLQPVLPYKVPGENSKLDLNVSETCWPWISVNFHLFLKRASVCDVSRLVLLQKLKTNTDARIVVKKNKRLIIIVLSYAILSFLLESMFYCSSELWYGSLGKIVTGGCFSKKGRIKQMLFLLVARTSFTKVTNFAFGVARKYFIKIHSVSCHWSFLRIVLPKFIPRLGLLFQMVPQFFSCFV